jgi:DNA-binding transcriptional LysR family regulator
MELDLFRSFVAVAEARSFSRAAGVVHSTQPTLSRQIARLEGELGVRLFERYGRHVECTESGQLLLPLAKAIVSRTDEVVSLMREQAGGGPSTVRFGAAGNVIVMLTPVLAAFLKTYPKVTVDLVEKDDSQLEEAVITGELDCAVITPWGSTRAMAQHLMTEEILLVVPEGHRLAELPAVPVAALASESLLLPRATMNASNVIADALRRAGVELHFSYRANYPDLSKALVRMGLGLAPMPRMLVSPEGMDGLVALSFDPKVTRDLAMIAPRDRPLPGAARALMAHVRDGLAGRSAYGA